MTGQTKRLADKATTNARVGLALSRADKRKASIKMTMESYLLLGILANIKNNPEEAFKRFKAALYVQPDCWLAHFYLTELFYSLEQIAESRREYGVTLKLLQKRGVSKNGLTFFPLSFSVDQLIHLCEHNLDKLKSRSQ